MNHKIKAPLITCEGIDGSGKSTIAQKIYHYLAQQNLPVILTKEPGGTRLGKAIRTILQHHQEPINPISEFLLFAADRAEHLSTIVKPALNRGTWVISDRMHDSSVAYQGYGRALDIPTIHAINTWALQGIEPTITLYLAIDPSVAHERINKRNETKTRFEKEKDFFWQDVIKGFETIFAQRSTVLWLDAHKSIEEIFNDILKHPLFKTMMETYDPSSQ